VFGVVTVIWGDGGVDVGSVECRWGAGILVIWCDNVGLAVHWSVEFGGALEYVSVMLVGSVVVVVVICIVPEESSKLKGS